MKAEPDPYSVLGVARTANRAEIRAAYLALVAKYHPDRHQGNPLEELAGEKLVEVNRAYEMLSDAARRAAYDGGAGAQPFANAPGSVARKPIRWLQLLAVLFMLPLAIRFGSFLVRLLVRGVLEVTPLLRGTPVAAGLVLLTIVILVLALIRQRRAKRKRAR
jgi:hypothetical protein